MFSISLYPNGLEEAVIVRRVNRFTVEVKLNDKISHAHNTNTGRLLEYLVPGRRCLLKPIKGRKLKYRVIGVEDDDEYALVDTYSQTLVFEKMISENKIPWLSNCILIGRHPKILNSRLDYLMDCGGSNLYIEVKSAVLRNGLAASYPDCPSMRGRRHIRDVIQLFERGINVKIIFIAALPKVNCFKPYRKGDPVIDDLLKTALKKGVDIRAIAMFLRRDGYAKVYNIDLPLCDEWVES